jgi:hypothetical protein
LVFNIIGAVIITVGIIVSKGKAADVGLPRLAG